MLPHHRLRLRRLLGLCISFSPSPGSNLAPPVEASSSLGKTTRISTYCSAGTSLATSLGETPSGPRLVSISMARCGPRRE